MKGILGRKLGMTQVFTTDGALVPVTVIEVTPNVVLQKKTVETDGYNAIQLGAEDKKNASKPETGHAAKAETSAKRFIKEIRSEEMMKYEVGNTISVDIFEAGEVVDVTATSKGKGYKGTIYRNNSAQGPKSHGGSKNIRHVGSLCTTGINTAHIQKNTPMPGHEGHLTVTTQNLTIVKVDAENNYLLVKGHVPGPKRAFVTVKSNIKGTKNVTPFELIDYTAAKED